MRKRQKSNTVLHKESNIETSSFWMNRIRSVNQIPTVSLNAYHLTFKQETGIITCDIIFSHFLYKNNVFSDQPQLSLKFWRNEPEICSQQRCYPKFATRYIHHWTKFGKDIMSEDLIWMTFFHRLDSCIAVYCYFSLF